MLFRSYPQVFRRLALDGAVSPEVLAGWFVDENHQLLQARGRHPLVGGALSLSRMPAIAQAVERLSDALLSELRSTKHPKRARRRISNAMVKAQQYDTNGDLSLEGPDQLTDLGSLAHWLATDLEDWVAVHAAATELRTLLAGIKRVGDTDSPWMEA